MPIRESLMKPDIELAFLADRVINSLSSNEGYSENDRIVFKKAKDLFSKAIDGQEVLATGQLRAKALELLGAYNMTLNAYAALAESRRASQKEDIKSVINELRNDMDDLASGIGKQSTRIETIREFFSFIKDISARSNLETFDKVKIGIKF
jgi:hypothetical protein